MTDIFKALTEDHREVLDILRTITAESDPQRRRVLFDEVKGALRTHSEFERKAFYPEAERRSDRIDHDEIASDLEEHDEAEAILKAMETEDPSSDAWMQHCRRLYNAVEEHAGHEEHVLFPPGRSRPLRRPRPRAGRGVPASVEGLRDGDGGSVLHGRRRGEPWRAGSEAGHDNVLI